MELANEPVDPISLYESRIYLESLFGKKLSSQLKAIVYKLSTSCLLAWPRGKGARKMTALAWRWLALGGDIDVRSRLLQVIEGDSMTMTRAALNALHSVDCQERELAMKSFYNLWKDRPVILDAWFSLEAGAPRVNGLGRVRELMKHPRFDPMAPNALRAVLGGFTRNTKAFHSEDGSGYKFIANQIIYFDKRNPITTSRIAKIFCRWRSYLPNNSLAMHKELCKLAESELSSNTREVIELILSE